MKRIVSLTVALLCLASTHAAWAAKGNQQTGFGPIQAAMSGTGVAAPLDAFTIILNPAGMTKVPNRVDFAVLFGIPIFHMDTSAAPVGNAAAGNQEADVDVYPMPFISTTWGFLDNKLALGVAFVENGGSAGSYKQSRVNPALTGNTFDTFIDYRMYKFIPSVAYQIMDNLSVGVAFHLGYATFSTDMLTSASMAQTRGNARTDNAFGYGGSLGVLYEPIPDKLSLGVTYTSKLFFQKFKKYTDALLGNSLDAPQQVTAGISGKPFDNWILNAEFQWLNWSGVSAYGNTPANGGLGWRDSYVAAFGTQYSPIDRVHLRAGYYWQTSVVRSDTVFANAFVPLVTEHGVDAGIGVDVTDKLALNLSYSMAIKNSKTQTGGDAVSMTGTGTKVNYVGHAIGLGASYVWNEQ